MKKVKKAFTISFKSAINGLGAPTPALRSSFAHGALCGFTLAETLLTLMIVGIIATMTIPAVMHHIEKVSLHTAFLKAYSTAEQAHKAMMRNNGGSLNGADFENGGNLRDRPFIADSFSATFRCTNNRTNCWHAKVKYPNGGTTTDFWGGFKTADGMLWMYQFGGNENCSSTSQCFRLHVDINGFKNPNTAGRDVFQISFFSDRILPYGAPGTGASSYSCAIDSGWAGSACAFYELTNKPKVGFLEDY